MQASHSSLIKIMARLCVVGALSVGVAGCTVVNIDEDKARRLQASEAFNPEEYANRLWASTLLPYVDAQAKPLATLVESIEKDLPGAGKSMGRQAGEGSPFIFIAKGEGKVVAVTKESPIGVIKVDVGGRLIEVQAGPYITGSALRDCLPLINFNDFTNQVAFAEASSGLNRKALKENQTALANVNVGQVVNFTGVFALSEKDQVISLTAVRLEPRA